MSGTKINIHDMGADMGAFAGAFSEGGFSTGCCVEAITGMSSDADSYGEPSGP